MPFCLSIENAARSLPMVAARPVILKAFEAWGKVANLSFTEKLPTEEATIEVSFEENNHADGRFGSTQTLAHAYFPNSAKIAGDVHFNNEVTWANNPFTSPAPHNSAS